MAVTLILNSPTEHHRNPSGLHNKVNWIISKCKWDENKFDELEQNVEFGEASSSQYHSWSVAFLIAYLIISKRYEEIMRDYPQYRFWIKDYINAERKWRLDK